MRARPISAIVFGILNIGFGAFNLLSLLFLQILGNGAKLGANSPMKALSGDFTWITALISAAGGIFLAVAGVGLLMCKNWGRVGSLGWAIFDIVLTLVSIPQSWKVAQAFAPQFGSTFAMVVTVFGLLLTLIYPVALVIFMRRPTLVAACRNSA